MPFLDSDFPRLPSGLYWPRMVPRDYRIILDIADDGNRRDFLEFRQAHDWIGPKRWQSAPRLTDLYITEESPEGKVLRYTPMRPIQWVNGSFHNIPFTPIVVGQPPYVFRCGEHIVRSYVADIDWSRVNFG